MLPLYRSNVLTEIIMNNAEELEWIRLFGIFCI